MKKLLFTLICILICTALVLSSCSGSKTKTTDGAAENDASAGNAVDTLDEQEEETPVFEYNFSSNGAVLTAFNGDLEEVVLEENPVRIKKEKQTNTVTEEVTNDDGTTSTVTREVEETVEVPVEYTLVGIDAGVFMGNEKVTKIVIPDTVKEIGLACFQGCTALEEVVLPEGLEKIADRTFYGCDSLRSVNIPDSVKSIGMFAFGDYFNVTPFYASLTDGVVGDGVLLKHTSGSTARYDGVKSVAYYAFTDTGAKTVYFSDELKDVSELAFYRSDVTAMLPAGSSMVNIVRRAGATVATYDASGEASEISEEETETAEEADAEAEGAAEEE